MTRLPRPSTVVALPVLVALVLAGAWLAAPRMGTDLSAQLARADFFTRHGWAVLDLRWYGGISPHSYSLVSPPVMAWAGPRLVGAAAAVVSALALALLLRRTGARRPALAGVLGAAAFAGNLVSGRVTFALGVGFGLLALLALTDRRPAVRGGVALPLAALAAASSPVAGLFLVLAGGALTLSGVDWRARRVGRWGPAGWGLALAGAVAVPMAVMAGAFGAGGWMNISRADTVHAVLTSLAVAVLVPRRAVRIGALLSAGGVLAAYLLPTPVGLNATRLATMFALPVLAGYAVVPAVLRHRATSRRWLPPAALAATLVAVALWQPPVLVRDLVRAADPAADPGFFAPLRAELATLPGFGRVEVVPTEGYWEVAYLGEVPLARGWLRQADLDRNGLFFDGTLDAGSYRRWLHENAVSYVAVPAAELSWVGRAEAELIAAGLPYLTPVWEDDNWRLYAVDGATPLVSGPATVTMQTGAAVRFQASAPAEVLVRVQWSRWLSVSGPGRACLAEAGRWTVVRVDRPGEYELSSAVLDTGPTCSS